MALRDKTFADLIQRLCRERYAGNYSRMAKALDFTTALVYAWKDGSIKTPTFHMIERLAKHFGLDPVEVYHLTRRGRAAVLLLALALGATGALARPLPVEARPAQHGPGISSRKLGTGRVGVRATWGTIRRRLVLTPRFPLFGATLRVAWRLATPATDVAV